MQDIFCHNLIEEPLQVDVSGSKTMVKGEGEVVSQEKYDSYLTKLQNICTEQVGEEGGGGGGPGGGAPVKPVYESMKSAIQNMSVQTAQT